jgi:hypothetical protein
MNKRIVWHDGDGNVKVEIPAQQGFQEWSSKTGGTEDQFLEFIAKQRTQSGGEYYICDDSELPSREYRNAWEYDSPNKKIKINQEKSKRIQAERMVAAEDEQIAKSNKEARVQSKMALL